LITVFGRIDELLDRAEKPSERELPVRWGKCIRHMFRLNLPVARGLASEMLDKATKLDNTLFVAAAHAALSRIEFFMGNHVAATPHHESCERLHDVELDKRAIGLTGEPPYIASLCFYTVGRAIQGYVDDAVAEQEAGLALCASYEIPMVYIAHKAQLAWLHMFRGMTDPGSSDLELACRYAGESSRQAVELGFPQWQIYADAIGSAAQVFQGRCDKIPAVQGLIGAWESVGADCHFCWLYGCVAHGALAESNLALAGEALEVARIHVARSGEHMFDSQLLRLRARLLQARGAATDQVEATLLDALTIAEGQQARLFALYIADDLLALGHRDAAMQRLGELASWWRDTSQGRDIRAVRRLAALH